MRNVSPEKYKSDSRNQAKKQRDSTTNDGSCIQAVLSRSIWSHFHFIPCLVHQN